MGDAGKRAPTGQGSGRGHGDQLFPDQVGEALGRLVGGTRGTTTGAMETLAVGSGVQQALESGVGRREQIPSQADPESRRAQGQVHENRQHGRSFRGIARRQEQRGGGADQFRKHVGFRHGLDAGDGEPAIHFGAEHERGPDAAGEGGRHTSVQHPPVFPAEEGRLKTGLQRGGQQGLGRFPQVHFFPQGFHAGVTVPVLTDQQGVVRNDLSARAERQSAQSGFASARQSQREYGAVVKFESGPMHNRAALAGEGVADGVAEQPFERIRPLAEKRGRGSEYFSAPRRDGNLPAAVAQNILMLEPDGVVSADEVQVR